MLRERAEAPLDDIADGTDWPLCQALLTLLAASDETCAGVAAALDPVRTAGYRYRARADELLARTGSLSRFPAHRLRVLPKVRTPPGGISFRSLSRYLCLRGPEVEVAWHKVPARRSGLGQQQANVLLLPWPLRIRQRDFRPVPGSVRRAENEPFGIFEFAPAEPFDLDLVERTLRSALDEVDGVDAVVFPESSVPAGDLDQLEALLGRYGVTLLLAGVRETTATADRLPANWVHLGVHIGTCWSHYRQNKHHRWFLDESQINQYHLAGALHPSVRWWEAMEVPRRSLQFLELSEGLTLVTVVCEDLARLDEVAELLRDVGPTLVITILLDGPQLGTRWTARYASVLADDPGSAVLTLSALGMVQRSRPTGTPPSTVVAMWKDPARGLREISMDPGSHGVLMSVAATRARRRVADGRTPVDNAPGLVVAGVHPVTAAREVVPHAGAERTAAGSALPATDLTIVTAWADSLAEAMEHSPELVDQLVEDAAPGAPWRRELGVADPSPSLARALSAVSEAVRATAGGDGPRDTAVLALLQNGSVDGDSTVALARAVLRAALEARRDTRAVTSHPG
ncbi:hypothetical protein [Blastococcus sp. PRF04-17]|uniref:hypothetical protein n=1 Tax=Blastococcus sp. PRF04-17 TaxID=2933797 RepID=UPI001FF67C93|nr:hypothetical protein [Blastococcus sp. PRF04-17]UOY03597.1 hypothetical protein MVA48_09815 [Blastococcus sp. PRF04-17]